MIISSCLCRDVVRKLPSGEYRLYSLKKTRSGRRRNLGTYRTRREAERRERQVRYFKTRDAVVVQDSRVDPTGTSKIRRRWEAELVRRLRLVRRQIRQALVELDVLGLRGDSSLESTLRSAVFSMAFAAPRLTRDAVPPPGAFAFATSGEKVASFMQWLYEMERENLLSVSIGTSQSTAAATSWQNVYIDAAYQKGIRDAYKKLGIQGSVSLGFNQPIHADRVGLIYSRVFRDLEGITDAMDLAISRALAQGMAEGRGVMSIARDLDAAVENIGIARARTLARTEVIAAHAEAALNSYEEAGVEGVEADVEFTTSEDDAVCPECESLQGHVYSVAEARGVIPVHPNCRCAWVPVIK